MEESEQQQAGFTKVGETALGAETIDGGPERLVIQGVQKENGKARPWEND